MPVDAVSEFRILTLNAPAEYGETSGATTSMVTKSGSNGFHGDVYEFLRNNAMDSRNFFAAETEPLHRNQYGATLGGPIRKDKDFFFVYYEGQRDSEGKTQAAIVPTAAERTGEFSGLIDPPRAAGAADQRVHRPAVPGEPDPVDTCRARSLWRPTNLYPLPNIGTNVFESTQTRIDELRPGRFPAGSLLWRQRPALCAVTPRRLCTSSTRCPSPERACPAFRLPTIS